MLSLLLLSLPFAAAQAPPTNPAPVIDQAEAKPQTPAQELADLNARYAASELPFQERLAAFQSEFEQLAENYQGHETGLRVEIQLLQNCWYLEKAERSAAAKLRIEHILEHYADSQLLGLIAAPINYLIAKSERDALLQRISKLSKHDAVKATALFFRARIADGEARIKMFNELDKKYGKLKYLQSTFSQLANAHLKPHKAEDLKVGKTAPEIVGVDLNGKPMRLSDYRGKVVVLDFWGDW